MVLIFHILYLFFLFQFNKFLCDNNDGHEYNDKVHNYV